MKQSAGRRASAAAVGEIRRILARDGIRIATLAAATGIPRSTLHNKLSGRGQLTVADLVRIAIALDVPAAELFAVAAAAFDEDPDGERRGGSGTQQ